MTPSEFLKRLSATEHRLFPAIECDELAAWKGKFPGCTLPEDLLGLYRQFNGVQLWVHEGSPEGYFSLLSLRDIQFARRIMWGDCSCTLDSEDVPLPHWLAVSEHQDGAAYIVLDPDTGRYFLMDTCGADLSCPIGSSVEDVLDFVWQNWVHGMRDCH